MESWFSSGASGNTIGGSTAAPGTGAGKRDLGKHCGGVLVDGGGTTDSVIEGNLIGTNLAGSGSDRQCRRWRRHRWQPGNTVGGTVAGAGNVISGNSGDGVAIQSANSNLVTGNWIGTNALGTAALGNTGDGVYVNQSTGNTIGGTAATSANLISGNANGVEINDANSNYVQGNLIGTDTTGTLAMGNRGAGVLVDAGSSSNTIGGPVGGSRNVISGNAEGVEISGGDHRHLVAGNLIGTDMTGTFAVGNTAAGVSVSGASGTTIGGTTVLARNVISANAGDGIDLAALRDQHGDPGQLHRSSTRRARWPWVIPETVSPSMARPAPRSGAPFREPAT